VTAHVVVVQAPDLANEAAHVVAELLPHTGSVVVTGGTTAANVYPRLAGERADWSDLDVFFSDERAVPQDHEASNYGMAKRTLLDRVQPRRVVRVRGELPAEEAAALYDEAVADAGARFDVALLGLGADAHVAALFPGSPGLVETAWAVAVDRPDGMAGVSLTPPALLGASQVVFVVAGRSKAEAVALAIAGEEDVMRCPAAMFREHDSVTFVLDEAAAARL
jgi:6-phosphogluconolactonase